MPNAPPANPYAVGMAGYTYCPRIGYGRGAIFPMLESIKKRNQSAMERLLLGVTVECVYDGRNCVGTVTGFTSSSRWDTNDVVLLVELKFFKGVHNTMTPAIDVLGCISPCTICCLLRPYRDPNSGRILLFSLCERGATTCVVALPAEAAGNAVLWGCRFAFSPWAREARVRVRDGRGHAHAGCEDGAAVREGHAREERCCTVCV